MSDEIKINFNKEEMCRFIKNFDPTAEKYMISKSSASYVDTLKYDDSNKSANLKKNMVPELVRNSEMIYGNARQSAEYGQIYTDVMDKFLLRFVSIPDLGSLFDAQYMDFEWNMHSDINFTEHRNSYYRDHFIHQVRNLFMTFSMIEDKYIYHNVKQALTSSTRSKVTQYFNNRLNAWKSNIEDEKLYSLLTNIYYTESPKHVNRIGVDAELEFFCTDSL